MMSSPIERPVLTPNPSLKDLEILVGEWDLLGKHPLFPSSVRGHDSFGWLENGALLVWHLDFERPGPPCGMAVVGRDDAMDTYAMLYYDERGVSRIYTMSLEDNVWKFWRESPDFSQRMTATISEDANTITGHGLLSRDGVNWEGDLDLTYTKVK